MEAELGSEVYGSTDGDARPEEAATGDQTEPNTPAPVARSKPSTADPFVERQKYLGRLKHSIAAASSAQAEDIRAEAEYVAQLPPSERFNAGRDGKVMARWQERQRDWERLQQSIASQLGNDPSKLLMADSNEYRERVEEYQTVQAAVPLHERNLGNLWEMSLRNGGSRLIPVGNIFSGLFCPLKADIPLPKIVRRPGKHGNDVPPPPPGKTWRDDHALQVKKRHLKKHLAALRPHEISPDVGTGLVVRGQNLLEWALDSSKAHFKQQDRLTSGVDFEGAAAAEGGVGDDARRGSVAAGSLAGTEDGSVGWRGPRLHMGPSPYILLEAGVAEPVEGSVKLANRGSTTIFYEWKRQRQESMSIVAIAKRRTAEGLCRSDPSARFAISKDASTSRFLCQGASGVLMPGETKSTVFAFESPTPGSFSETWCLAVTPTALVEGELIPSDDGVVAVSLLGAAITIDTNEHRRQPIRRAVEANVIKSDLQQLVTEVVRCVRTPVREETVRLAQKTKFEGTNVDAGLNYTAPIYDAFEALWVKVNALAPRETEDEDEEEPLGPWDGNVMSIRKVIERMVVPDEMTAGEPEESAVASGEGTSEATSEAESEEEEEEEDEEEEEASDEESEEGDAAVALEPLKGDGGAPADGAAAPPPFFYEEEEEDEDDTLVEEETLGPMQIAKNEVELEWKLLVARSAARPLPDLSKLLVDQILGTLADAVVDSVEGARALLRVPQEMAFAPLPSPFGPFHIPVDEPQFLGEKRWREVHNTPVPQPSRSMGERSLGGSSVNSGGSHESVLPSLELRYRSLAYANLSGRLSSTVAEFEAKAAAIHASSLAAFASRGAVDLQRVAALRLDEDVRGKRVLLLLDLDVGEDMICDPFKGDEFGVPEAPRLPKVSAAGKIIRKVLREEPAAVIITTELTSPPPEAGDERHPVPPLGDLSVKTLEPMLLAVLKVPVLYCASVATLEEALSRSEGERPRVVLLDHVDHNAMVPLSEPEAVVDSDDEEDRLPWLGEPRDDPALQPPKPPQRLDLGDQLLPVVDTFICDTPSACLDAERSLPLLAPPHVHRVMGPTLRREVASTSVLLSRPKRPMLAIVAGDDLLEEVKHIDRMIDIADDIVIAGRIGLVFLAALGHKTGAVKHDPAHVPMARALLTKAQMMGVAVTLPVDFVMGDILVDAHSGAPEELDPESPAEDDLDEETEVGAGFDYDGETLECTVSEGLMRRMHALDLGNQTITLLKELVEKSNTVVWTGLVGVAQCSAFQNGTRELTEAVVSAHEDRNAHVMLGGADLVKWAGLFSDLELEGTAIGDGNGVTHTFKSLELAKRLLAMVPVPGLEKLATRDPTDLELMLEEEVLAKRLMDGTLSDDDMEETHFDDDDDGEFGYDDDGGAGDADY